MTTEILAPLPGKIVKLSMEPGKSVEEDSEIMVIEAMKMETAVYAPCDGVIDKVLKNTGDEVEEDELIAVIS
jgi:biotin carboxyl carrier protein